MLTQALRSVMFSSSYKWGAKGSIITTVSRDSQNDPQGWSLGCPFYIFKYLETYVPRNHKSEVQ